MTSTQFQADLGSPRDLEQRLALLTPQDTARGYFFKCTLELIQREAGEEALKRCQEKGELDKPVAFFNYPIHALVRLLFEAAEILSARYGGFEGALRHMGRQVANEFLGNTVGKTLLLLSSKDPKQLADSLPSAYKTGWQHGRGEVRWTGPGQCIVLILGNVVPYPYFEGVFQTVFKALGPEHVKVKGRQVGLADSEYELSWG
jgi:uncharacterized protein (TIGR02265 family)